MPITLTWNDTNTTETGHKVYRSLTPMTVGSLPVAIATLDANVTSYTDSDVVEGQTYYYRVAAVRNASEAVSSEITVQAVAANLLVAPSGLVLELVTDGPVGDPYWNNVVSLLHFDESVAKDEKEFAWSNTSVTINADAAKFGQSGAVFNNAFLRSIVTAPPQMVFGDGDFTVELWVKPKLLNSTIQYIIGYYNTIGVSPRSWALRLANNRFEFLMSGNGETANWILTHPTSLIVDAWYHVAAVRKGNATMIFVNGMLGQSLTVSGALHQPTNTYCSISGLDNGDYKFTGHMDEIRVTKGVARYTADFTPPTEAFPNS